MNFCRLHIERTVLPESSTASVLTPLQAELTALEFSQTIICPHAVPLAQSSHLLIFLFRKQFFLFFFSMRTVYDYMQPLV